MANSKSTGWKKYFKTANTSGQMSPIAGQNLRGPNYGTGSDGKFKFSNYASRLPEVYTGHPNRMSRYNQYENMDNDSEINACLDILAEFSTQPGNTSTPFDVNYTETPTDQEVIMIKQQLQQWCKRNELDNRLFRIFRNTLKYGDQVFVRDPETFILYWVETSKVSRIIVNESEGKRPEQYIIKDINPNLQSLAMAAKTSSDFNVQPQGGNFAAAFNYTSSTTTESTGASRFQRTANDTCIDAKHVVHLSLSEGLDPQWPFGTSILETIFKVFKQKELLEDAILIYRVQRAPERRVFYIDVGEMPSHLAMEFIERVKNEIHQRRIPSINGGRENVMDATYNPLSINEDYFFAQTAGGRGSKVETLPGGEGLGQIDDLKYFNNKLCRGLRIPSSYLPTGPDDSGNLAGDGKVGTALIQEYRFNQYCQRLQRQIIQKLDEEFKMFLRWRGFNIDAGLFNISFAPPQNFASYRQSELDTARISSFGSLENVAYFSKRFLMSRYLGLTEEELVENEKLWREENEVPVSNSQPERTMRGVGVSPAAMASDIEQADNFKDEDFPEEPNIDSPPGPDFGPDNGPDFGSDNGPDFGSDNGPDLPVS